MGVSAQMRQLLRRPVQVFYANRTVFTKPGVHVWLGPRFGHLRVLPLPRRRAKRRPSPEAIAFVVLAAPLAVLFAYAYGWLG